MFYRVVGLPVHRGEPRAQGSVASMGELYLLLPLRVQ